MRLGGFELFGGGRRGKEQTGTLLLLGFGARLLESLLERALGGALGVDLGLGVRDLGPGGVQLGGRGPLEPVRLRLGSLRVRSGLVQLGGQSGERVALDGGLQHLGLGGLQLALELGHGGFGALELSLGVVLGPLELSLGFVFRGGEFLLEPSQVRASSSASASALAVWPPRLGAPRPFR